VRRVMRKDSMSEGSVEASSLRKIRMPTVPLVEAQSAIVSTTARSVGSTGLTSLNRLDKACVFLSGAAAGEQRTEPSEARGDAQFPELGLLLLGDAPGSSIQFLGGLGLSLPQQQLAFVPVHRDQRLGSDSD
jgi:hypothetical protein